jgi:hypothetical protein
LFDLKKKKKKKKTACTKSLADATNFGTGGCTRVTAAPTGVFTVSFTGTGVADQAAFIGIVATCPNTKITVKCGTFTAVITTVSLFISFLRFHTECTQS